jgi:hypothetical protein
MNKSWSGLLKWLGLFIVCGHFEYEFNDDFTKKRRKRLTEIEIKWKEEYYEKLRNS